MPRDWPTPSPRVRELIRRGAEVVLNPPAEWVEELQAAAVGSVGTEAIAEDPALSEGSRRSDLANVFHWAAANLVRPGERVPVNLSEDTLSLARDLTRRGLSDRSIDGYRTGQNAAWQRWMSVCFSLTSDPAELRELLEVTSLSITTFLDDMVRAISERMHEEGVELTRGTHAERLAIVAQIIEGTPVTTARAEERLGYALTGPHIASVIWGGHGTSADNLEDLAARMAPSSHRLIVPASTGSIWVWLAASTLSADGGLEKRLAQLKDVRVAVGRPGHDLDGFRRSHLDALATQRLLTRLMSPHQIARFEDVQLVDALTADPARAEEFITDTLGELAAASREIKETLLTYLREQCNAARAAESLFTHRNTVLRRVSRADQLLPRSLAKNPLAVAAALEVLHWRGELR
jgi:DNA-binding PucR family transcriptional regulator